MKISGLFYAMRIYACSRIHRSIFFDLWTQQDTGVTLDVVRNGER